MSTELSSPELTSGQIEYKVSAPAIQAARALVRNFEIIERSGGEVPYCDHNLAVLIDVHTKAWKMREVIKPIFARKDFYYPDLNNLEENIELLQDRIDQIDALRRSLPQMVSHEDNERMHGRVGIEAQTTPGAHGAASKYGVSAAALHAVRQLQMHFIFIEREGGIVPATEKAMAELIDMTTQALRLEQAMNELCTSTRWQSRDELRRNLQSVRRGLHAVDVAQMRMPNYGRDMKNPLWKSGSLDTPDPAQDEARRRRHAQIQEALKQAKNPQQAARILHDFSR